MLIDKSGQFGVRVESALAVRSVHTKHDFNGPIWLGFERLTCVPIQPKMCAKALMNREEREWLKVRLRLREAGSEADAITETQSVVRQEARATLARR